MGWAGLPILALVPLIFGEGSDTGASVKDPRSADFFEARIRPILVDRCISCHGPEAQKAGLRLDSAAAVLRGGDSGPIIEARDPEASPLVWAIRYDDVVQMPPDGKLPDTAVADLTEWVRLGTPWPESPAPANNPSAPDAVSATRAAHWAFLPVQKPAIPDVQDAGWPTSPIDRFILAALEARELRPAPEADRRTLIRRATIDLTGLPPTPEEVDAFLDDDTPDAFDRLVDRLLATPQYGERWGRHWLDLARYADSKGYVYGDREEARFPFAFTYRDYVIRSFNEDRPYDRFLREQVAADLLADDDGGDDQPSLAALGFLTLGRRFLGNVHDVIDDRLDVLFRATQALTVSCARCHDHKFDPIPTEDYYSLYGVFAATTERTSRLVAAPGPADYEAGLHERQKALDDALLAARSKLSDQLRTAVADYLAAVPDAERFPGEEHYVILSEGELNPLFVHRWRNYLLGTRDAPHPIFEPWHAFEALTPSRFSAEAPALAGRFAAGGDPDHPINPHVARLFDGAPPASMSEVAARYASLLAEVDREWRDALAEAERTCADAPSALADRDREALRHVLYADDAPSNVPPLHINQIEAYFEEKTRIELGKLQIEIDRWHLEAPAATPHALVLEDAAQRPEPRVFLRGNPKTKGPVVPRRFLRVLAGEDRSPFAVGSGRRELAECIASPDNPLTARVLVNRLWMHHFGEGLVRTPSDFGTRGDPPTHPELLDFLARTFIEDGWSIKAMHRRIMNTRTYRQSAVDHPAARAVDPENRLLWRANRRRLEWEALRDAMLATAGSLDLRMEGRPVPLTTAPFPARRSVYGLIDRQDLPGVFRVFNLANPDQHTPRRHETTIPQQALFLMNNPFVVEQARALAARTQGVTPPSSENRLEALYRFALQRPPSPTEREAALRLLSAEIGTDPSSDESTVPPWHYGTAHFDEASGRLGNFQPLAHWTGTTWQRAPDLDQPMLTRNGGRPGPGGQAVVRRWVAPGAGVVSLSGQVRVDSKAGGGVLALILGGRAGELGRWEVVEKEAEAKLDRLEVEPGDTIDFVVTGRGDSASTSFSWAPRIQLVGPRPGDDQPEWDAAEDFVGPPPVPLSAWELFAQALLLANEFTIVD